MKAEPRPGVTGTVTSIWRYPVKSMQGEPLRSAEVTECGVRGDRAFALIETATNKVVSAKNPRKWAAVIRCQASYSTEPRTGEPAPEVMIRFPSGRTVSSGDPDVGAILSSEFGHGVSLQRIAPPTPVLDKLDVISPGSTDVELKAVPMGLGAPAGTFFDFAPLHILATNTLDRLSRAYPNGRFDVSRFRPNIAVTLPDGPSAEPEKTWSGVTLHLGTAVKVNIVMPTFRCVLTTLDQGDLPHDPGILRTIAEHNLTFVSPLRKMLPTVGVYGHVEGAGALHIGDPLRAGPTTFLKTSFYWLAVGRNLISRSLPAASVPFFGRLWR